MESQTNDFIVTELLAELKTENTRKAKLNQGFIKVIIGMALMMVAIVAGFLLYLNQYDFSSTATTTATGVYALIDSEGNVIAQDLTDDEINTIMEVLNGTSIENDDEVED